MSHYMVTEPEHIQDGNIFSRSLLGYHIQHTIDLITTVCISLLYLSYYLDNLPTICVVTWNQTLKFQCHLRSYGHGAWYFDVGLLTPELWKPCHYNAHRLMMVKYKTNCAFPNILFPLIFPSWCLFIKSPNLIQGHSVSHFYFSI